MNAVVHQFIFNSGQIRAVADEKGNVFFCAKDVCDILSYANYSDTINKHCKAEGVAHCYTIQDSMGRTQRPTFISEGNLYRLIIKSNMPQAVPFLEWIALEILPVIRKTGVSADMDGKLTSIPQE